MKKEIMNKKEAKEIIENWFALPRKEKAKTWDYVYPYMNKYPDLYEKGKKYEKKVKR